MSDIAGTEAEGWSRDASPTDFGAQQAGRSAASAERAEEHARRPLHCEENISLITRQLAIRGCAPATITTAGGLASQIGEFRRWKPL